MTRPPAARLALLCAGSLALAGCCPSQLDYEAMISSMTDAELGTLVSEANAARQAAPTYALLRQRVEDAGCRHPVLVTEVVTTDIGSHWFVLTVREPRTFEITTNVVPVMGAGGDWDVRRNDDVHVYSIPATPDLTRLFDAATPATGDSGVSGTTQAFDADTIFLEYRPGREAPKQIVWHARAVEPFTEPALFPTPPSEADRYRAVSSAFEFWLEALRTGAAPTATLTP